jgi:hypothetical protein
MHYTSIFHAHIRAGGVLCCAGSGPLACVGAQQCVRAEGCSVGVLCCAGSGPLACVDAQQRVLTEGCSGGVLCCAGSGPLACVDAQQCVRAEGCSGDGLCCALGMRGRTAVRPCLQVVGGCPSYLLPWSFVPLCHPFF